MNESIPSDNIMGTVIPAAISSDVFLTARALFFGLIGLLEGDGQRGLE